MNPSLHIIKIGGKLINDAATLQEFLQVFVQVPGQKILIHGGGRKATELSALLGIETKMIDGRRITNKETLEVAIMVYAGLINKSIVVHLQKKGVNALGLSGADLDIIRAHKRPVKEIDFGFVGDIDEVNADCIKMLMRQNITPVLAPISHDGNGQLLNTNADTIAAQTAIALSDSFDVTLSYCFEFKGVLYDLDSPQMTMNTISEGEFINMKSSGTINSGMIPKLSNGIDALKGRVARVDICGINNLLTKENATNLVL